MKHNYQKKKYSWLTIDKFLLSQLDAKSNDEICRAVKNDKKLSEAIQSRKNQANNFLSQYPSFGDLCENNQKEHQISWRIKKSLLSFFNLRKEVMFGVGFAVVVSCLLIVSPYLKYHNPTEISDLNTKGTTQVGLIIKRANKMLEAKDGSVFCLPADTLQFYIISHQPVFYAIYSIDNKGKLQKYLPIGDKPAKVANVNGTVSRSLILPKDWEGEIIKCLYSKREFTLNEAVARLTNSKKPDDSALHIQTFILEKEKNGE